MASAPKSISKNTVSTPLAGGGRRTVTTTVTRQGGNVTKSRTVTITPKKTISTPKKASGGRRASPGPVKLARVPLGGTWVCGPNEDRPLCGPVAIANSLLALTGVRASSGDLERLYRAAGGSGESGAPLDALLAAAERTGLAGCGLEWRPATACDTAGTVLVLALPGIPDLHAAATTGDGRVISWGEEFLIDDLGARVDDAWCLSWR